MTTVLLFCHKHLYSQPFHSPTRYLTTGITKTLPLNTITIPLEEEEEENAIDTNFVFKFSLKNKGIQIINSIKPLV